VLLTFAVMTCVLTALLRMALVQTVICAVLIQIGYFTAVLFLARLDREQKKAQRRNVAGACQITRP
jgi:exopolysaccharide production repressor protein